jgi:ABC-type phosphate transport system permease subunit
LDPAAPKPETLRPQAQPRRSDNRQAPFTLRLSAALAAALGVAVLASLLFPSLIGLPTAATAPSDALLLAALMQSTAVVVSIAVSIALLCGVAGGVTLIELGRRPWGQRLHTAYRLLNAVPSVVVGCVAFGLASRSLTHLVPVGVAQRVVASVVLGLFLAPGVALATERTLSSDGAALEETVRGLGAQPSRVLRQLVLPGSTLKFSALAFSTTSRALGDALIVSLAASQKAWLDFPSGVVMDTLPSFLLDSGATGAVAMNRTAVYLVVLVLVGSSITLKGVCDWVQSEAEGR